MPYIDAETGEEVKIKGADRGEKYFSRWVYSPLWELSFQSKREADRADELWALVQAGEISQLLFQPKYLLQGAFQDMHGKRIRAVHYQGDFQYDKGGRSYVEDSKGYATEIFKLKAKLFKYRYPNIELRLV